MTAKVKSVLTVASEALETAAGYALVAVGLYAAIFVDMTGGGSLWKTMHSLHETAQEGIESPNATRIIKVPTQVVAEKVHEDRMLAVFDEPEPTGTVAAVYPVPDSLGQRPSAAMTDSPASASMSAGGGAAHVSAAPAVAAAEGSAARAEAPATARPGMSSRLSRGALSESNSSRNVR